MLKQNNVSTTDILAVTVGGSPRPIAFSISHYRPRRVVFFASKGSEQKLYEEGGVLQLSAEWGVELQEQDYTLACVDHQNLYSCFLTMYDTLHGVMALNGWSGGRNVLDLTGGTKLMSAALALAGEHLPVEYGYVGACSAEDARDKEGLGVTLDGREHLLTLDNPADFAGYGAIQDAIVLFQGGAYDAAARLLKQYEKRLSDHSRKNHLIAWRHLCRAYAEWDKFKHREALESLENARRNPEALAAHLPQDAADELNDLAESHRSRLEEIIHAGEDRDPLLLDILANAERRAEAEEYDEAIVRLYRAAELFAKDRLEHLYAIKPTSPGPERLPESFLEEMGWSRPNAGNTLPCLNLQSSYKLLLHFNDEAGMRFQELKLEPRASATKSLLDDRNCSILIHGLRRAESKNWKDLRYTIYRLLRVDESRLVRFPELSSQG